MFLMVHVKNLAKYQFAPLGGDRIIGNDVTPKLRTFNHR